MQKGHSDFKKNGYLFVPDMVETSGYYNYINKLEALGMGKEDRTYPGAKCFYKEPLFEKLLESLLPRIESLTGYKLNKTYSYARQYKIGNILKPHKDREACEFTVSLALGSKGGIWPIWIEDRSKERRSLSLKPGDAVILFGSELTHWREENKYGPCAQVFFHYVDQDGPFAKFKDDATGAKNE